MYEAVDINMSSWLGYWTRAMHEAAVRGNLPTVKWLAEQRVGREVCANKGIQFLSLIAESAAQNDHSDVVQYLFEQGEVKPGFDHSRIMVVAIKKGHLDFVMWLYEHSAFFKGLSAVNVIEQVVVGGIDMSAKLTSPQQQTRRQPKRQRMEKERKPWRPLCVNEAALAAGYGNLAVIQWLHKNRWNEWSPSRKSTDPMDAAATYGHLDVLKWLHSLRSMRCSTVAMDGAAAKGYLNVVQWLHENRQEGCTTDAMDNAARNGYLEVVKWLHTNRTEGCTTKALDFAAKRGTLKVVQWLWENRTESCTTNAIDQALVNRRTRLVRWLLFNTTARCSPAMMDSSSHLKVMQWLHATGRGVFTHEAIENAICRDKVAVVSWLLHNFPDLATTKVDIWYKRCSFDMLLFLREHCRRLFTNDFIRRNAKARLGHGKSAHEMDAIGWLLSQFPAETRGAIMLEGPDDLLSHLLE